MAELSAELVPLWMSAVVVPFLSVMVMVAPSAVCVTVAVGLNPSAPAAPS